MTFQSGQDRCFVLIDESQWPYSPSQLGNHKKAGKKNVSSRRATRSYLLGGECSDVSLL